MSPVTRDGVLAGVCAVVQILAVQPGNAPPPSATASGVASVAAIGAGMAVVWRRSRPLHVLAAVTLLYVVQAVLVGPIVPAAAIAAGFAAARFGPQPVGPLAGLASAAV
ncbi:MAG: hypothetical protein ACRDWY_11290, partial [Actinomycetes bacterium]